MSYSYDVNHCFLTNSRPSHLTDFKNIKSSLNISSKVLETYLFSKMLLLVYNLIGSVVCLWVFTPLESWIPISIYRLLRSSRTKKLASLYKMLANRNIQAYFNGKANRSYNINDRLRRVLCYLRFFLISTPLIFLLQRLKNSYTWMT